MAGNGIMASESVGRGWELQGKNGFWLVFLFLILGDFISICQISPTINYNYLNSSLLYIASGLILWASADKQSTRQFPLLIGAGFCAGLDLFVKFPAAPPFILLVGLWLWFNTRSYQPVFQFALGCLLGVASFFLFVTSPADWQHNFSQSLTEQTGSSHNPLKVINRQIADGIRIGKVLLRSFLVPLTLLGFIAHRSLKKSDSSAWLILPLWLIAAWFVAHRPDYPIYRFRVLTVYFLVVILSLLIVHLTTRAKVFLGDWRRNALMLFLLVFPFLLFIGSAASFSYSMPIYAAPWFALILLLLLALPPGLPRISSLATFLVISQVLFVLIYLYHPWRWVGNRLDQTVPAMGEGLSGILVAPEARRFMQETRQLTDKAQSLGASKQIITFYELPGVVYWLGGVASGLPTLFETRKEQEKNCLILKNVARSTPIRNALVLHQDKISDKLAPCLTELDIDPANYKLVGVSQNPYLDREVRFLVHSKEVTNDKH